MYTLASYISWSITIRHNENLNHLIKNISLFEKYMTRHKDKQTIIIRERDFDVSVTLYPYGPFSWSDFLATRVLWKKCLWFVLYFLELTQRYSMPRLFDRVWSTNRFSTHQISFCFLRFEICRHPTHIYCFFWLPTLPKSVEFIHIVSKFVILAWSMKSFCHV